MPKCSKCGAELFEDSKFCPECGAKVEDESDAEAELPKIKKLDISEDTDKEDKQPAGEKSDEPDEDAEETDDEDDDDASEDEDEDSEEEPIKDIEETREELEKALEDIPEIKQIDGVKVKGVPEKDKPEKNKSEKSGRSDIKPEVGTVSRRDKVAANAQNIEKATNLRNKALAMDFGEDVPAKPKKPISLKPIIYCCAAVFLIVCAVGFAMFLNADKPANVPVETAAQTTLPVTTTVTTTAETTAETTVETTETTVTTVTSVTTSAASSRTEGSGTDVSGSDVSDTAWTDELGENNVAMLNRTSIEPAIHSQVMAGGISCTIKLSDMLITPDLLTDASMITAEFTTPSTTVTIGPVGMKVLIGEETIDVPCDAFTENTAVFSYASVKAYVEDKGHTAEEIDELAFSSVSIPVDVIKVTVE